GFPTANVDRRFYLRNKLRMREGVYAGTVRILPPSPPARGGVSRRFGRDGVVGAKEGTQRGLRRRAQQVYRAGIIIGPEDTRGLPKIEAHLIGFSGNLYGKKILVIPGRFLRPFISFQTEKALQRQIKKDLAKVRRLAIRFPRG
ncbi:MAG: riboflavin kinase, partial [bacterium]|nr:riboflavin kinase [bacterium]